MRIRIKMGTHQLTGWGLLLCSSAEDGLGSVPRSLCSGNREKEYLCVGVLCSFLTTDHLADVRSTSSWNWLLSSESIEFEEEL